MRIGLTGAHRTGKTTLAVELAKEFDLKFIRTNVIDYYGQHNLFPNDNIPIKKRYEIQQTILHGVESQLNNQTNFISDRTPIDFFSYALKYGVFPDMYQYHCFRKKCFNAMKLFDFVIFVRLGIPIEQKAGVDCSYDDVKSLDEIINVTLKSFQFTMDYFPKIIFMPNRCNDLQKRIDIIKNKLSKNN